MRAQRTLLSLACLLTLATWTACRFTEVTDAEPQRPAAPSIPTSAGKQAHDTSPPSASAGAQSVQMPAAGSFSMLASSSDAGGNELGAFTLDPWGPGDYPRDATSGSYLILPNLDGQRGFVRK